MSDDSRVLLIPSTPDDDDARALIKLYAVQVEWMIPGLQSFLILYALILSPYKPGSRQIIIALAGLHLALIPAYRRGHGPLAKGGWRFALFFIASLFVMPLVAFFLAPPHTYGANLSGVPLYSYAIGTWLVLASYPWRAIGYGVFAWTAGIFSFVVYPLFVLTLIYIASNGLGWENILGFITSQSWLVLACVVGRGAQDTGLVSIKEIHRLREAIVDEFQLQLHSDMKNGIIDITHKVERLPESGEREAIQASLKDLMRRTVELRIAYYLTEPEVQLGKILDERLEIFESRLIIHKPAPIMAMVDQYTAQLIDRALSDLLTNAHQYGATTVTIDYDGSYGIGLLSITDNGPGFPDEVLEDPSTSLFTLREQFRSIGGNLRKVDLGYGLGTTIELYWNSRSFAGYIFVA